MAYPVAQVPDPWEQYKDGQIWKLTPDEARELPGFRPSMNASGEIIGRRQMQWFVDGHHYIRFFDERIYEEHPLDWPDYLAGWI